MVSLVLAALILVAVEILRESIQKRRRRALGRLSAATKLAVADAMAAHDESFHGNASERAAI
jgi:hypothetical protein